MSEYKIARVPVTDEEVVAEGGGVGGLPVRLWVEMPVEYDPDAVTAEDIVGDPALKVVPAPPRDDAETQCPSCGTPALIRTCHTCGVAARLIDCGHYWQPRPIAAGRSDGSDGHHDYCTAHAQVGP